MSIYLKDVQNPSQQANISRSPRKPLNLSEKLVGSLIIQFLSGVLICALLPAVVRWGQDLLVEPSPGQIASIVGAAIAYGLGLLIIRRLTNFPGVQATSYIVPSFIGSFALLVAIMFFWRIEFTRYQIIIGLLLAIGWAYVLFLVMRRSQLLHLNVIPFGNFSVLMKEKGALWHLMEDPEFNQLRGQAVVADLRADIPAEWERFLAQCALKGIPVYHIKQIAESLTGRVQIEHLSENNLGSLLPSTGYLQIKAVLDIMMALLVLPILFPFMLFLGLAIRLTSPGPALFRQTRMGYRGETFTMYKFRSMHQSDDWQGYTQEDDPRITAIGKIIRKYRIDELPQILNILRGEMSWIGPRPEALELSEWYDREIPFYSYRHIVRPGISGWAQVQQGSVAEVDDVAHKLHYDFYYIKHFSAWLDLLLVLKTVKTVLTGFGAR